MATQYMNKKPVASDYGYVYAEDASGGLVRVSQADFKATKDGKGNDIAGQFSQVNDDILELADKKITKFYASSLGDKTLVDSDNGKFPDINIFGKSVQTNYSGKNLLENKATTQTINGITFTVNEDKSVTVNGTATAKLALNINTNIKIPNGTYIMSGCVSGVNDVFHTLQKNLIDGTKKWLGEKGQGATFTVDDTVNILIMYIEIGAGTTLNNATFYPMIRLASITDDTYEPYVGGEASPNPSYPQAIESVADDGNLVITTTNNDGLSSVATIALTDSLRGIKVTEGGNYTDETGQQWVCDTLEKYADGTGKYIKRVYHKVFDGTESIISDTSTGGGGIRFVFKDSTIALNTSNDTIKDGLCNKLTVSSPNLMWTTNKDAFAIASNGGIIFRLTGCTNVTDVATLQAQLKEWYDNGEPLEFICELAEYVETDLTAEELAELEKLQSFYHTTNIMVSSGKVEAGVVVNYAISLADGWNYIKQQLGDIRDFIYDMEIQSAEAYINSEYAVALIESEVM